MELIEFLGSIFAIVGGAIVVWEQWQKYPSVEVSWGERIEVTVTAGSAPIVVTEFECTGHQTFDLEQEKYGYVPPAKETHELNVRLDSGSSGTFLFRPERDDLTLLDCCLRYRLGRRTHEVRRTIRIIKNLE